jgi:hypothetical protein
MFPSYSKFYATPALWDALDECFCEQDAHGPQAGQRELAPDHAHDAGYQDDQSQEIDDRDPGQPGHHHGQNPENDGHDAEKGHAFSTGLSGFCNIVHDVPPFCFVCFLPVDPRMSIFYYFK